MFEHITSEKHRRSYLVSRYPILESMIQGMDNINLMERAKEEEDKYGGYQERDYDAIESVEDNDKYMELSRMNQEADKDSLLDPDFGSEGALSMRGGRGMRRGVAGPQRGDRGRFVERSAGRMKPLLGDEDIIDKNIKWRMM